MNKLTGAEKRKKRWEKEFIPCIKHPLKKAQKYGYIIYGSRRCNWCMSHRADGVMKPARKGSSIRSRNKADYKKSLKLRSQLRGRLRGLALFERVTGMKVPIGLNTTRNPGGLGGWGVGSGGKR